jgi:hypothetical protein
LNYRNVSRCTYAPWRKRIDPGQYPDEFHYLGVAEENIHNLDINFLIKARAVFLLDSFDNTPTKLQEAIVGHPQQITVHIESLRLKPVVEDIWDFCLPGIPFPEKHYQDLRYKRIDLEEKEDYTDDYTEKLKATVARLAH